MASSLFRGATNAPARSLPYRDTDERLVTVPCIRFSVLGCAFCGSKVVDWKKSIGGLQQVVTIAAKNARFLLIGGLSEVAHGSGSRFVYK
jgi:hypothetical protein